MCIARKNLINLNKTKYYHCSSRIVRRSFLCGYDSKTCKNYDYRRDWIINRIRLLSRHFAIEVCAYAIMANHYHLVLKVNLSEGIRMTQDEVIKRWTAIHPSKEELKHIYDSKGNIKDSPQVKKIIRTWKRRLLSISWYMSALNYNIARRANKEDGCKGHFWEGRFSSQPLVGEASLLNCMAYVDLNPIRAGIASNLMECYYTSVRERIQAFIAAKNKVMNVVKVKGVKKLQNQLANSINYQPANLSAFYANASFSALDYLKLVDLKGRQARVDKKGYIRNDNEPIVYKLGVSNSIWDKLQLHCKDSDISILFDSRTINVRCTNISSLVH